MKGVSRRGILAAGAAGGAAISATVARAAGFGNPDQPPEGAVNVTNPRALAVPGPHDSGLADMMPAFQSPPATDVGSMPQFWASFNLAPRRIQDGGWGRQVTQADFAISTEIAGVDMRLSAGGIRELHWHQQAEWAIMTYGHCRITVLDAQGRPFVADVKEGDLWYFPAGLPHSLQGLAPDGAQFVLAFDNGASSEFNTLLATDWMAHTPPEVLAKNFGVPADAFRNIPVHSRWIFQGEVPPPLDVVKARMASKAGVPAYPFTFSLYDAPKMGETAGGYVQIADSTNFPVSRTVAAGLATVRPGAMRTMHWHPNADEWQYYLKGEGRMTVFNAGPEANTANFRPGDVGYVKKGLGHYVENTGKEDLVFVAVFRSDRYEEVSFADWLAHSPPEMVAATFNLSAETVAAFPRGRGDMMPG
ncbi:cupin domain-containing protein [Rhodopila sp.]|jgi:oxalate decarboxylase|uniref:cupin domain-containing protein n=1 Tax=Rhodopila sp. TaxID=2480087 RepID=UPI002C25DCBE|nr:cupin domain-containing protein [Rhodopila sp.]HVZ07862.1 cupin domain-containing protein [Rhodopila sp.]